MHLPPSHRAWHVETKSHVCVLENPRGLFKAVHGIGALEIWEWRYVFAVNSGVAHRWSRVVQGRVCPQAGGGLCQGCPDCHHQQQRLVAAILIAPGPPRLCINNPVLWSASVPYSAGYFRVFCPVDTCLGMTDESGLRDRIGCITKLRDAYFCTDFTKEKNQSQIV